MDIKTWLFQGSWFGISHAMYAALTALAMVEWVLGKFGGPRTKSVLSAVATAIHTLLVTVRFDAIPIIGPLIVAVLGAISNAPPAVAPAPLPPGRGDPPKAA